MTVFEFFSVSAIVGGDPLTLEGVWIHDPVDPDGTARQFRWGKNARSDQFATTGVEQRFAGREFPVVDFGEYATDVFTIKIVIDGGNLPADRAALRAMIASRDPLTTRDNRGRIMTGVLLQIAGTDQEMGVEYSFEVHRVDTSAGGVDYDAGA